ncbi:hypothetical protein FG167_07785 [Lacinutrix sp. WUR7]|uniref:hypothetical protein n=1 Tax=Lacinutrix sp. WUR7 TaxID=2653681 RepID=UPI00193E2040|nr:hypothetical protein [Lacinutrix sp. WUR7]QRM89140.1 hypothetical protein FG167_07785 [Lacinutrix sp. WUR7]
MKLTSYLLFSFLSFFTTIIIAQNKSVDSVITALQKDQLFFEKVFIHTNKSEYNNEDTIWFKAYVTSNENKPSLKTTLLYVSLFSATGDLIETQNILINEGVGIGQFELFGALKSGDYYIQANTNYMRNFGNENTFVTKVKIGNVVKIMRNRSNDLFDIQLFPEGGYLLEDVKNVVAIKVLVNGKGSSYSGKIMDSKNNEIVQFNNEYLGMSTCEFYYKASEKYKAIIKINDTILKLDVPKAKPTGLRLKILNTDINMLNIELQTNKNTLNNLNDNFSILFHQNNKLIDRVDVTLKDTLTTELKIQKEGFFNGVNTVTVFKNSIPILERKFFVQKVNNKIAIKIEEQLKEKDSIVYNLHAVSKANLSVSILSNQIDYQENTNIESAFLLTPYINGFIENPSYYFNEGNSKRYKYLDLLLLTQGWTQYNISEYIDTVNPKYKYDFEIGFKLSGKVSPLVSNNMVLINNANQIAVRLFLNGKTEFSFKNLVVYKGDSIKVSFIKPNQEIVKPRNIYFDTLKVKKQELINNVSKTSGFFKTVKKEALLESINQTDIYCQAITELDTVNLKNRIRSKQFLTDKKFNDKYRKYDFHIGGYYKLDVPEWYLINDDNLGGFLRSEKGLEKRNTGGNYYLVASSEGYGLSIDGKEITPINEGLSLPSALSINMNDIEVIAFQSKHIKRGFPYILVVTTDNYKKGIKELYKKHFFTQGFNRSKKYYTPIQDFNILRETQEIDWKPIVKTNELGETQIRIKKQQQDYSFYIQGFTENGELINEIISFE